MGMYDEPYPYRYPIKNKWIHEIDTGNEMLKCPECECRVSANAYSYAVGRLGYSFCPYCGTDLREEVHNENNS